MCDRTSAGARRLPLQPLPVHRRIPHARPRRRPAPAVWPDARGVPRRPRCGHDRAPTRRRRRSGSSVRKRSPRTPTRSAPRSEPAMRHGSPSMPRRWATTSNGSGSETSPRGRALRLRPVEPSLHRRKTLGPVRLRCGRRRRGAADVACGRRGYHDGFVDGYLELLPPTDEELGALGSLWKANVLRYVAGLSGAGIATDEWNRAELDWCRAELDKTVPYRRATTRARRPDERDRQPDDDRGDEHDGHGIADIERVGVRQRADDERCHDRGRALADQQRGEAGTGRTRRTSSLVVELREEHGGTEARDQKADDRYSPRRARGWRAPIRRRRRPARAVGA